MEWFSYILEHPKKPWSWRHISGNPNLTFDIVKEYSSYPWNYKAISAHENVKLIHIRSNPDFPWDYDGLSSNPHITWDFVCENADKPWDFAKLSENPAITWEIVCANPDKPWDFAALSDNPNITWEIVEAAIDKPWDFKSRISDLPEITIDIVKKYNNKEWGFDKLTIHSNFTPKIIEDNSDMDWYYPWMPLNPHVTIEMIRENQVLHENLDDGGWKYWDASYYEERPDASIDDIIANPDIHWSYQLCYKKISMRKIMQHSNLPWNYASLLCNSFVKWKYVKRILHLLHDSTELGHMQNLTWEIVDSYQNLMWWTYGSYLSSNPMNGIGAARERQQRRVRRFKDELGDISC